MFRELEGRDPLDDYRKINGRNYSRYSEYLAGRPQLVAANKMDLPDARKNFPAIEAALKRKRLRNFSHFRSDRRRPETSDPEGRGAISHTAQRRVAAGTGSCQAN